MSQYSPGILAILDECREIIYSINYDIEYKDEEFRSRKLAYLISTMTKYKNELQENDKGDYINEVLSKEFELHSIRRRSNKNRNDENLRNQERELLGFFEQREYEIEDIIKNTIMN